MEDDKTGLMQLTNTQLLHYGLGQKQLTPLEMELLLRLEATIETRTDFYERMQRLPCMRCPVFPKLIPEDVFVDLDRREGVPTWA